MTHHEDVQSTAKAHTIDGRPGAVDIVAAWAGFITPHMTILAQFSVGRILLHLLAMLGDQCIRFHAAGISRELPWFATALRLLTRARTRLIGALVPYLSGPIKPSNPEPGADPQSLAPVLNRGDVLLGHGNTHVAAVVKCITQSL
jgi:hypothetical protein